MSFEKSPLQNRLLSRKEVATRLGVCTETVKRWQHNNKLKAIVFNDRVVRYEWSAVELLMRQSAS